MPLRLARTRLSPPPLKPPKPLILVCKFPNNADICAGRFNGLLFPSKLEPARAGAKPNRIVHFRDKKHIAPSSAATQCGAPLQAGRTDRSRQVFALDALAKALLHCKMRVKLWDRWVSSRCPDTASRHVPAASPPGRRSRMPSTAVSGAAAANAGWQAWHAEPPQPGCRLLSQQKMKGPHVHRHDFVRIGSSG